MPVQGSNKAHVKARNYRRHGRAGYSLIEHYDSAAAPCGCVDHRYYGVECTVVRFRSLDKQGGRYPPRRVSCCLCGASWMYAPDSPYPNLIEGSVIRSVEAS